MEDLEKSDSQVLQEAGNEAFAALEAKETAALEVPAKPEETPAADPAKPEPTTTDKGEDDKFAWMKGLDEKQLDDIRTGKLVPHARFNEVLERSKAYESLGTPEDVSQKLADLSKKIEATPKGEEPELTEEEKETQAVISKLFPQLKTFNDMQAKIDGLSKQLEASQKAQELIEKQEVAERKKFHDGITAKGREKIREYATKLGWDANDKATLDELEGDITGRLHMDKAKADKFYVDGDVTVLDQVFESYQKKVFSGASRETEAKILKGKLKQEKLLKPPLSGAPSTEKKEDPAEMSWDDIGNQAVSLLG